MVDQEGIVTSSLIKKSDGGVMINKNRHRSKSKAFDTSRTYLRGEQIRCRSEGHPIVVGRPQNLHLQEGHRLNQGHKLLARCYLLFAICYLLLAIAIAIC